MRFVLYSPRQTYGSAIKLYMQRQDGKLYGLSHNAAKRWFMPAYSLEVMPVDSKFVLNKFGTQVFLLGAIMQFSDV